MNVLWICDANNPYTYHFIKHYLEKDASVKFTLYSCVKKNKFYAKFNEFYKKNNVKIFFSNFELQNSLFSTIERTKEIAALGDFDCCHIMSMQTSTIIPIYILKHKYKRIISTFWGSDLFRTNKKDHLLQGVALKYSDDIILLSKSMFIKFHEIFGGKFNKKLKYRRFGSEIFEEIQNIREAECRIESLKKLNFPEDRTIVVCGYNGKPSQQHSKIIAELTKKSKEYKDKVFFVFPFGNKLGNRYTLNIKLLLENSDLDAVVLEKFMLEEDVARLRICADIYVNMQTTDAFSASLQEHLLAGSIVINAKWLTYPELEKAQIYYLKGKNISDLNSCILNNIELSGETKEMLECNAEKIINMSSWDKVMENWVKLYHRQQ